ncbi:alkaline phosphatase family protein [Lysinibacillus yapensis]|uniref:Alkaline phosphatase family protein n=1 Tax=Ureibacillus yapensis TaxID=2304605 RepID=A0A396SGC0_9BACL|nr:alkaline phosphatase family protein [Lysinibacillus yapensis]RHW37516.1 alkaline phosphatase family protein [Lysinibacillus yapensis]
MKRKIIYGLTIVIVLSASLILAVSISPTKDLPDPSAHPQQKPVILIVVDSLMNKPLQKAADEGKIPAFSFLINYGRIYPEMISSYPTMSVTIDSTLLTGTYPEQHKIPGLIWFKEDEGRIISYGSGIGEIWNTGVRNVAKDSVIHLNETHLSKEVQTIHENLASSQISSASINGIIYRGSAAHQLNVPKLIGLTNLLPKEIKVNGPTILSLGALSQYNPENDFHKFIWNRLGVNNKFTANELSYLIKQNKLPAFILSYLPDADAAIHKHGPNDLKGIEKADQALQDILNSFSSWEEALQKATWIVMGDSGQSSIKKDKKTSLIDLNKSLNNYSFWEGNNKKAQLAIAINERMAYIYVNDKNIERADITKPLKKDERIGFIAWKEGNKNYVTSPGSNEELTFSPNGPYVDEFGQSWEISGDFSILDLKVSGEGRLQYNDYPDALARLRGALHAQSGRVIIVDAKPAYEFIEKHSHDHAGGAAHGSLHKVDSLVPMIVAGTDEFPEVQRLVDLKKAILQLLDRGQE